MVPSFQQNFLQYVRQSSEQKFLIISDYLLSKLIFPISLTTLLHRLNQATKATYLLVAVTSFICRQVYPQPMFSSCGNATGMLGLNKWHAILPFLTAHQMAVWWVEVVVNRLGLV